MIQLAGDVKLEAESGDPHSESVLHWATAIDMNAPRFKQASNLAAIMAPSLGIGAFSWIGESFSIYLMILPFSKICQKHFLKAGSKVWKIFLKTSAVCLWPKCGGP